MTNYAKVNDFADYYKYRKLLNMKKVRRSKEFADDIAIPILEKRIARMEADYPDFPTAFTRREAMK